MQLPVRWIRNAGDVDGFGWNRERTLRSAAIAAEFPQLVNGAVVDALIAILIAIESGERAWIGNLDGGERVDGAHGGMVMGPCGFEVLFLGEHFGLEQSGFHGPDPAEPPVGVSDLDNKVLFGDIGGLPLVLIAGE